MYVGVDAAGARERQPDRQPFGEKGRVGMVVQLAVPGPGLPQSTIARCTDRLAPIANAAGNRRVIVGDDRRQARREAV